MERERVISSTNPSLAERLLGGVWCRRRWVWLGIFAVYAAGFNGQWRITPDSVEYATRARLLAEGRGPAVTGGDPSNPETSSFYRQRNPGLPRLIAAGFRLFGADDFRPAVLAIWLTGLGALGLTYWLFSLHADRRTALVVTALVAVSRLFYQHAFELLTDMPFLAGLLLFLVGYERSWRGCRHAGWNWILMATGVAVMGAFRSVALVFLAALAVNVLWYVVRGPKRLPHLAIGLAMIAVVLAVRLGDSRLQTGKQFVPDAELAVQTLVHPRATVRTLAFRNIPMLFENHLPQACFAIRLGPGLDSVVTIAVLGLGIGLARRRLLWGLVVAAFATQWLLFLPDRRYVLAVLPLLAYAWWQGAAWLADRFRSPWAWRAFALALAIWAVPNALRVGQLIGEQRRVPFLGHYKEGRYVGLAEMGREINRITEPDSLIIVDQPKILSAAIYYSRRRVVDAEELTGGSESLTEAARSRLAAENHIYIIGPADRDLQRLRDSRFLTWKWKKPLATAARNGPEPWALFRAHRVPGSSPSVK